MQEIVGVPGMPRVIVASTLGLAWLGLNIAFASLFLTQLRGYSLNEAGNILSVSAIIGFSGVLLIPTLADNLGRKTAGIVASIGAGVCFLIFPLVPMPTQAPLGTGAMGVV